jgi:hypothetical protein
MALKKALTYKSIALPDAYFRVVLPTIDSNKTSMSFGVWAYPTEAAAADAANMLADVAVTFSGVAYDLIGKNVFEQAYTYLKTLADYAGAIDVLEPGQTV